MTRLRSLTLPVLYPRKEQGIRTVEPDFLTKLKWSLPWLGRYPLWRAVTTLRSFAENGATRQLIVVVANHFEPSWKANGVFCDLGTQKRRVESWVNEARAAARALQDHDGTPFRHTYFYPAEQYHRPLIEMLADLEADGLGEVEIHLRHGVESLDTAERTRRELTYEGAVSTLLRRTVGAWVVSPDDRPGIVNAVRECYRSWKYRLPAREPDSFVVESFDRRRTTGRIAELLDFFAQ